MQRKSGWAPARGVQVLGAERVGGRWLISAVGRQEAGLCPGCGMRSKLRHGWYVRRLRDLPVQGAVVTVRLRISRWRCRNGVCGRRTFAEQSPEIAAPHAHRTMRMAELVELFGHGVGGRPGERLMKRLGMPASDDTILRQLKRRVAARSAKSLRVAGIDDWSWRKGCSYGTIVVDLERREVVDVLSDRSAAGTADWLSRHPEVEIVSRDRCGLYAQGAREGAPQARQVADRFHLLQNLRETIETQLSRADRSTGRALLPASDGEDESAATIACSPRGQREVAEHRHLARQAQRLSRQAIFDRIRTLHDAGSTASDIARKTGFDRRSITKWLRLTAPAERRAMAPKPCSPGYYLDYLSRRWAEGCVRGRALFHEIKLRGYTGSFSHLERLLAKWRCSKGGASLPAPAVAMARAIDPVTGHVISPIVAAALCIKPRGLLQPGQAAKVDALKSASPEFTAMRRLAMRFRGILRSKDTERLDIWLTEAHQSGIYAVQRFVRTLRRDIDAVRNALTERWSNGQTEGQINRLKTLKRAMYGRASTELLRARMLPLHLPIKHTV
ncbi:Transposase [Rhizobiales bacterium GAS113]|nr:Transposase [Rhizobiales bacterium GAS113]